MLIGKAWEWSELLTVRQDLEGRRPSEAIADAEI